jgi:hypothetical protein
MSAGAVPDAKDLRNAIGSDDTDRIREFLSKGVRANDHGYLCSAISKGKTEIIKILLTYDADPNKVCGSDTPLDCAIESMHNKEGKI